ncbi:hypothetical protein [Persephonella sp. KM09-Lau-8]|uniref:hypothetical protein n=1 Tax=Persephonella sp. KM09-Lau-8 TaxID=1158345 RepID=UPI000496A93E|nr:hypothetical protein [Persephonella sp. KM09-Lau-8]
MSKVIEGVIDLPSVDLRDLDTLYDLILFLQENELFNPIWKVSKEKNKIRIVYPEKNWTRIEIYNSGVVKYDNHYGFTGQEKEKLIRLINEYYPMYKKAIDILKQNDISIYSFRYDKHKEKILIEIEEI